MGENRWADGVHSRPRFVNRGSSQRGRTPRQKKRVHRAAFLYCRDPKLTVLSRGFVFQFSIYDPGSQPTMAEAEENSALFPIFILTLLALPLIPYTFYRLYQAGRKKTKSIECRCSVCARSGKYRKSIFKRVSTGVLRP